MDLHTFLISQWVGPYVVDKTPVVRVFAIVDFVLAPPSQLSHRDGIPSIYLVAPAGWVLDMNIRWMRVKYYEMELITDSIEVASAIVR